MIFVIKYISSRGRWKENEIRGGKDRKEERGRERNREVGIRKKGRGKKRKIILLKALQYCRKGYYGGENSVTRLPVLFDSKKT